jgi:luciferase family oxidoreductase group 1
MPLAVSVPLPELPALPLSVLDVAPVQQGSTASVALAASIQLARHVEDLGFTRFWLAEHHNMPGIASAAPAVAAAAIGQATTSIRIGSGGVMLPNHASLVVAEQFGTLEALFPGRVDLGIGRAPGTDQATAAALRGGSLGAEQFPQQLGEIMAFFRGQFPPGHPYASIQATPGSGQNVPMWLLGSSGYSARLAGALGLPFAFAHHFSAENTLPALELYRSSFQPSDRLRQPYAMIAVQVVCGVDDEHALALAMPSALSFVRLRQGRPDRLPTVAQAAAHDWTAAELQFAADRQSGQAVGGPATVQRRLAKLLAETDVDELMVTTMVGDAQQARASMTRVRGLFPPVLRAAYEGNLVDLV